MPARTVWVTGAGSGMGRAAALAAAREGWRVALSGRRRDALDRVAAEISEVGGTSLVVPLDVTDVAAIRSAARTIAAELGPVDDLVLSAGRNAPRRYWRDQDMSEFAAITETNLVGPAAVIDAVLPGMRERGSGTIVVVSSYAAWQFSPDAGLAYSATKTGLRSLTRTLNAQESADGIRACHLCPGDVDSDFLDQRPVVPDASAREVMLSPEDVARTILFVLQSPPHVIIDELVVSPAQAE